MIHNFAGADEAALDDPALPVLLPAQRVVLPADAALRRRRRPAATPELLDIIPRDNRRSYDMRTVLDAVFDDTDWLEVQPRFGPAIICALAHLGSHPVAVIANQPAKLAGAIDADAADKAAHFITVADSFHLPLVFLADNPGMMPGSRSERRAYCEAGKDVRCSDGRHHRQAACDAAQGVRVQFDGDVDAGIRQSGGDIRLPGGDDGCDESAAAQGRAAKADEDVTELLKQIELDAPSTPRAIRFRRADLTRGDQERLAADAAARGPGPTGGRGAGGAHCDHTVAR